MMRRARESGFTLVESVTALFVFAVAAVAVLELNTQNARAMAQLETSVYARIVADNQMALALGTGAVPPRGAATGKETIAGRAYVWSRVVAPTTDPDIDRVEIAVRPLDDPRPAASMLGFRGLQ
jgi:general secretion pathway protein I